MKNNSRGRCSQGVEKQEREREREREKARPSETGRIGVNALETELLCTRPLPSL